jgi:hypothetical protein
LIGEAFEGSAALTDGVQHVEQIARAARQPVEAGDDQRVALTASTRYSPTLGMTIAHRRRAGEIPWLKRRSDKARRATRRSCQFCSL